MIERERRFLVGEVPGHLPEPHRIRQAYLTTRPAGVRVRDRDGAFTLTIKTGSGLARTEIERELDRDEFAALWQVATELRIDKRRHVIDLEGGHRAELDLYDAELAGHALVEVEFDDVETAAQFEPPDWFGREVTDDRRYTNAALATDGWPGG